MPSSNERMRSFGFGETAHIDRIDAIVECAREQLTDDYLEKYSMGQEMLKAIIDYIKVKYTHIKHISLNDKSYMPCDRTSGITLDLLSYSIAKYGKTWYEMNFNAYPRRSKQYTKEIQYYISPKAKDQLSFTSLLQQIILRNNFAETILFTEIDKYITMYETSKTFPDFFKAISNDIPRVDRCNFFKGWLEVFIQSYVNYDRDWIIDVGQKGGKTRRRRRHQSKKSNPYIHKNAHV
jgi:hypothetical protein